MLERFFSWPIVLASLLIGMLVSYTTIGLAGRIATLKNPGYRTSWLAGGAFSTGVGLWAMHFVGMLSFSLPIPVGYDFARTLVTLAIAIGIGYFALMLVSQTSLSRRRLVLGGTCMGLGTAAMHYTGMSAMLMSPGIVYTPTIVALSIVIAITGSMAALWIAFHARDEKVQFWGLRRVAAAAIMGTALWGLHFTGMAAAHFRLGTICRAASQLDAGWMAITVAGAAVAVLAVTLVLSVLDARLESQTAGFASTLESANDRLLHLATHDALTQLPNRFLLSQRLQRAIDAARDGRQQVGVFFLDLDGFKPINDSMGHSVGDAVLKEVAMRLRTGMRTDDMVARFGGDEFVMIAEGVDGPPAAAAIAMKLFGCFRQDFALVGAEMPLSPSIGISLYPQDGDTPDMLLRHADAAMYEAKACGRNRYRFYESGMSASTVRVMTIQQALRGAMQNGELSIEYQPKFICDGGAISGAEALLRWRHPELGMIVPDEFIPIAEHSGQIVAIGKWVVREVCEQLARWAERRCPPVKIAINLSPVQLRVPTLVDDILTITDRYHVPPSRIMFEITESVAMRDADATMRTLEKLRAAGFEMAIDDFGAGYSSLSYLRQFAVRQLKVDRSFVNVLEQNDETGLSIISSIIGLAHSMNMQVVAEGVETEQQLAMLHSLDCDEVQGFLLAKPLGPDDFMALVSDRLATAGAA